MHKNYRIFHELYSISILEDDFNLKVLHMNKEKPGGCKKNFIHNFGFRFLQSSVRVTCRLFPTTYAQHSSSALLEMAMWWGLPTSSKNMRAYLYRQTGASPFWTKEGIPSAGERGHLPSQESDSLGFPHWASEGILGSNCTECKRILTKSIACFISEGIADEVAVHWVTSQHFGIASQKE